MDLFSPLLRELDIFLGFSWRDWSMTLIPGSIFAVGAMRGLSIPSILSQYLFLIFWLIFFVYFFNLSGQITGVAEDRINKPDRPIPSGKVTVADAKLRWAVAFSTFMGLGVYMPRLLPETICWVLTVAFLHQTDAGSHWFGKNCVTMLTGTWALLSACWKCFAPVTPKVATYVYTVSVWASLITHIQDLRDIEGDASVGRRTLPLVFGDRSSRLIITYVCLPASYWVLWVGNMIRFAPFTLATVHIILGYRVLQTGDSRYDHKTYMFYTYTFCFLLALTAVEGIDARIFWRIPTIGLTRNDSM